MSKARAGRMKLGAKILGRIAAVEEIQIFVDDLASRAKVVNIRIIQDKLKKMATQINKEAKEFSKNA